MDRNGINQYDLIEVIEVPEEFAGVMEAGDVGVVVEKHNESSFEIECIQPGGTYKWLETLDIRYIRLKSRDPFRIWADRSLKGRSLIKPSAKLGSVIGACLGMILGGGLGLISGSLYGVLIGLVIGLGLGAVTGASTGVLTVKTAGTTGGVGVGYFTGMLFGGMFGLALGALIPTPLRMSAQTEDVPILDALMMGRFETAVLLGFLLSILGTIVGVWIGGKNQVPRNLKERYRP